MIFFNPCKKCLVRPICKKQCYKVEEYIKSEKLLNNLFILLSGINIVSISLTYIFDLYENIIYSLWSKMFIVMLLFYIPYSIIKWRERKKRTKKMREELERELGMYQH